MNITGLHHVTAIASDPQRNLDFYVGLLWLRLVKRTVKFDDPGSYHFYFGDRVGSPRTILTFFPWPDARQGVRGVGEIEATTFTIPSASLDYWLERLKERHVDPLRTEERFGEEVVRFTDPDGLLIELVATASGEEVQPWDEGPVPVQHSIRGLHSVSAALESREGTVSIGAVMDRIYFHAIYFRESGGILFEDRYRSAGIHPRRNCQRTRHQTAASALAGTKTFADRGRSSQDSPPNQGHNMTKPTTLDFLHTFVPGRSARTLLLLHGTGGDENDLIPVGRALDPEAALLSPRGKVLENGMPRFFRRLAIGVFDEEDLIRRTNELADFIESASEQYRFDRQNMRAVGYSNGANIAASLLLLRPEALGGAALLRPMLPLIPEKLPLLKGVPVLIAAAHDDTVAPPGGALELATLLRNAEADLTVSFENAGHGLTNETIATVKSWLIKDAS